MKKIFKGSLVIVALLATLTNLQAETVELSEADGDCPSAEISYLNNLTTHTLMEGTGTIEPDWDGDKYSFTPATDGVLKVHLTTLGEEISMKIDTVCNGSGLFRSIKKADHGEQEFDIEADQTIEIALWDWFSADGYTFDLNIEFTPDVSGEVTSKVSISQDGTSVGEGSTHTYTLSLDKPSSTDTVVAVVIGHITTGEGDVLAVTRDVDILATESSVTFTVDAIDDSTEESDETFTVSISHTDNDTVIVDSTSSSVTTTIIDDDGTIGGGDDAPVADAQSVNINKNGTLDITLTATDSDNDTLTYSIVDSSSNGSATIVGEVVTYIPATGYSGTDSFTFKANDGTSDSNIATVDITVNDTVDMITIIEDETLSEHFIGMPIDVETGKTTKIEGIITADWDMDRYSFGADNLGEVAITLKDSNGVDIPFYVLKNYIEEIVTDRAGIYNFGSDFSVITIMIVAQSSETSAYTLTIESPDTTLPVITLAGDATVSLTIGDSYTDAGATANDNKDGDIILDIAQTGTVDTQVAGTYTVRYNVSDAAGNAAVQVTREVIVSAAPDSYIDWVAAKNNLVRDVSEPIGVNTVKVLVEPTKQIGEDDTSKTTIVIYGNINGKNTEAKLKINENYENSTKMVVRVYSPGGDILATSNELAYTGDNIMFDDITFFKQISKIKMQLE